MSSSPPQFLFSSSPTSMDAQRPLIVRDLFYLPLALLSLFLFQSEIGPKTFTQGLLPFWF